MILCSRQYFSAKWIIALRAKKLLPSLFFVLKHLAAWGFQTCNFTKKRLQHSFFPVKFAKNLKNLHSYFEEHLYTASLDFRSMLPFITTLPLFIQQLQKNRNQWNKRQCWPEISKWNHIFYQGWIPSFSERTILFRKQI